MDVNPAICLGKACGRGTCIKISVVLDNIAAGVDRNQILASYPSLEAKDIEAARACVAEMVRKGVVDLRLERSARNSRSRGIVRMKRL